MSRKGYSNYRSPGSPWVSNLDLSQLLRATLSQYPVIRVEVAGELPHWLAAGVADKRALVNRGAPGARVWTICELESLLKDGRPLTLGDCLQLLSPTGRALAVNQLAS